MQIAKKICETIELRRPFTLFNKQLLFDYVSQAYVEGHKNGILFFSRAIHQFIAVDPPITCVSV